jgi:putative SOS response-associated peptidase YedK
VSAVRPHLLGGEGRAPGRQVADIGGMCGRFTLRRSVEVMAAFFKARGIPAWSPRYNIAPEQQVLTLFQEERGERQWALRRWGLVPMAQP